VIGSKHRPLPDNIQHSQETDIHASGEIRTCNPNKQAAVDPLLKPRDHWNRPLLYSTADINLIFCLHTRYKLSSDCRLYNKNTRDFEHAHKLNVLDLNLKFGIVPDVVAVKVQYFK
jgi:hypothetical protein